MRINGVVILVRVWVANVRVGRGGKGLTAVNGVARVIENAAGMGYVILESATAPQVRVSCAC